MVLGYCEALLYHQKYLTLNNTPENKITPVGLTKMLLEKGAQVNVPDGLNLNDQAGHIKDIRLKAYTRTTPEQMGSTTACDIDVIPAYAETTIDTTSITSFGIHFNNSTIARYCNEASEMIRVNGAPTPFMREHLAYLAAAMNGFIGKINQTLLSQVVWGTNQVNGLNTATTVNFNDDSTVNNFGEGWTKVLSDYAQNEGQGTPLVIGSGLINSAMIQAMIPAMTQYASVNNNAAAGMADYYYDLYAGAAWGTNQFGVFQPGTIGLVQLDRWKGFQATKLGNSTFWNMAMPFALPGAEELFGNFFFDVQLKEIDCEQEITVGYETETVSTGYQLLLSKRYALWQIPANSYQAADRLTGNRGSLRYTATNS
jgi:hypothetical protein